MSGTRVVLHVSDLTKNVEHNRYRAELETTLYSLTFFLSY